jgi:hypothetical protein
VQPQNESTILPASDAGEVEVGVMVHLKPRMLGFLTVAVWFAAIGTAAALTYQLSRPPVPQDDSLPTSAAPAAAAVVFSKPAVQPVEPTVQPVEEVLQIPEVTIVARAPAKAKWAAPSRVARDISEMRCDEWRELTAGSGRVQTCE